MARLRSGTQIAGQTAWHAGNDGHGSGLDADTVDGKHVNEIAFVDDRVQWVQPGDTIVLEALTERSTNSSIKAKEFWTPLPGVYRVTGELRSTNSSTYAKVEVRAGGVTKSFSTKSTSYVPFSIDTDPCLTLSNTVEVWLFGVTGSTVGFLRNVRFRYIPGGSPPAPVVKLD